MGENKIKVLLSAPCGGTIGGISRWTSHIFAYYEKSNDKSIIDLQLHNMKRKNDIYTHTSKKTRITTGITDYFNIIKEYKKILRNNSVSVSHVVSSASFGLVRDLFMLRYARKKQVKSIIHFHFGRIPDLLRSNNWEQKLMHKVIKMADNVVVIDESSYTALLKEGYTNIKILPNPLTPLVSEIIERNSDIDRNEKKILFAGHLVETKGIFELVNACKNIPNIYLKMIGAVTPEIKNRLISIAGDDFSNRMDIAGECDYETTIKEMLSAGVFVLPTYTEGFPNVIIESMACACPIIASAVGAIPEMLDIGDDNNCGIGIEPKNINQLKNAITKMLNDRTFALECGLNAQRRVNKEYSMPIVWDKLRNIWITTVN